MSSVTHPSTGTKRTIPDTRKVVPFNPAIHSSALFGTDDESIRYHATAEEKQHEFVDLARRKLLTLLLGLLLAAVIIAVIVGLLLGRKGKSNNDGAVNGTVTSSPG
ncbi:uncharacterized protein [Ptychodera flava]|uniref:uncharacterized protein n=1 Tax=Ptychodera flava TaxID=63121 RepID=UPI00396AA30B